MSPRMRYITRRLLVTIPILLAMSVFVFLIIRLVPGDPVRTMLGFRAMSSNQMPSANMLFGDWAKVVVAEWGVLSIEANPYANFQAGIVGIRALYSIDIGVRYGAAFSLATSIT